MADLHHEVAGPEGAPPFVLAGSLGSTLAMWEPQFERLRDHALVVRYDHPGHGASSISEFAGVGGMAAQLLRLLDALELARVTLVGLSLGGAVAMRLALDAPERLERLVLASTSARFGEPEAWRERAAAVREHGVAAVADAVLGRWFTADFFDTHPHVVQRFREMLVSTPAEGYARCCDALAEWDVREEIRTIRVPTLVVAAAEDPSTPPQHLELIADRIPGARLHVIERAAHLANVERPDEFTNLL